MKLCEALLSILSLFRNKFNNLLLHKTFVTIKFDPGPVLYLYIFNGRTTTGTLTVGVCATYWLVT